MKFIVVGDLHLRYTPPINRTDVFYQDLLNKLKEIKEIKDKNNVDYVFCLGDVFDDFVVDYAEKIIFDISEYIKDWYFLIGNHDCKERNGDIRGTTFGVLSKTRIININPPDCKLYNFDFYHYYNREEFYNKQLNNNVINIAFIHDYILPSKEAKQIDFECNVCENIKTKYDFIFCGHYHYSYDYIINNSRFINPGALLRKTIAKQDMNRKVEVVLYNDKNIEHIYLKSCRDKNDVFKIQESNKDNTQLDSQFINKLQNIKLYGNTFTDVIQLLKENKVDNKIIEYIAKMR